MIPLSSCYGNEKNRCIILEIPRDSVKFLRILRELSDSGGFFWIFWWFVEILWDPGIIAALSLFLQRLASQLYDILQLCVEWGRGRCTEGAQPVLRTLRFARFHKTLDAAPCIAHHCTSVPFFIIIIIIMFIAILNISRFAGFVFCYLVAGLKGHNLNWHCLQFDQTKNIKANAPYYTLHHDDPFSRWLQKMVSLVVTITCLHSYYRHQPIDHGHKFYRNLLLEMHPQCNAAWYKWLYFCYLCFMCYMCFICYLCYLCYMCYMRYIGYICYMCFCNSLKSGTLQWQSFSCPLECYPRLSFGSAR